MLQLPPASSSFLQLPIAITKLSRCAQRGNWLFRPSGRRFGRLGRVLSCCAAASSSFPPLPAASYSHHETVAMRATRGTILSANRNDLDDWGGLGPSRCAAASSSFLLLPAASYIHHEAVAMHATWEIILLIDCNGICTIKKASRLVMLQASYSFLQPLRSCRNARNERNALG